jgi:hypothetical protein
MADVFATRGTGGGCGTAGVGAVWTESMDTRGTVAEALNNMVAGKLLQQTGLLENSSFDGTKTHKRQYHGGCDRDVP